jgi:hypothetical protein
MRFVIARNVVMGHISILICTMFSYCAVPVAARSKAYVYGRLPAAIVVSNPTGDINVSLSCVCCQVEVSATS